jgi:hypothetical protein
MGPHSGTRGERGVMSDPAKGCLNVSRGAATHALVSFNSHAGKGP